VVAEDVEDERRANTAPLDDSLDGADTIGLLTVLAILPPPTALLFLASDFPFFLNLSNPKNPPAFLVDFFCSFSLGAANKCKKERERRAKEREIITSIYTNLADLHCSLSGYIG